VPQDDNISPVATTTSARNQTPIMTRIPRQNP